MVVRLSNRLFTLSCRIVRLLQANLAARQVNLADVSFASCSPEPRSLWSSPVSIRTREGADGYYGTVVLRSGEVGADLCRVSVGRVRLRAAAAERDDPGRPTF